MINILELVNRKIQKFIKNNTIIIKNNEKLRLCNCSTSGILLLNYVKDGQFYADVIVYDETGVTPIKESNTFEYSIERDATANINCLYVTNKYGADITRLKYMILGQIV